MNVKPDPVVIVRYLVLAAALAAFYFISRTAIIHAKAQNLSEKGYEQMKAGNLPAAISSFLRADLILPGMNSACRGLGEAYFALYRRQPGAVELLKKAEDCYGKALLSSPADMPSMMRLHHVRALRNVNAEEDLCHSFDLAAEISSRHRMDPTLQKYFLVMASDLILMPDTRNVIIDNPGRKETFLSAVNFLMTGDHIKFADLLPLIKEAGFEPSDLLRMADAHDPSLRSLAEYIIDGGRWESESKKFLKEARRLRLSGFHLAAARALDKRKRTLDAVVLLIDYLQERPRDAPAHFTLAGLSYKVKEYGWDFAEYHYKKALELKPLEFEYRCQYGVQLLDRKMYSRALEELTLAAGLKPEDSANNFYMGLANERLGLIDPARENYQKAVDLAPTNEHFRKALKEINDKG